MVGIERTSGGKSLKVEGSVRATDHGQGKVFQTLTKQKILEPNAMPGKLSRSQTIDLSLEISKATY